MIQQLLIDGVQSAMQNLFNVSIEPCHVQVQKTRKEFEGDLTIVVFPLIKLSKQGPEQTGAALGEYLKSHMPEVVDFNCVKGFLNLSISTAYWLNSFESFRNNERFGLEKEGQKPRVIVEYASPNTNKPLHLGHLRNIFLGDSVARILKAYGHNVSRVQIINDRGIHICKSMVAWQKFGNGETPQSSGLKGDKLVGKYYVAFDSAYKKEKEILIQQGKSEEEAAQNSPIMLEAQEMLRKWEAKDEAVFSLWETMNGWVYEGFNTSYATMGVTFDKLYYESNTYLLGRDEVMKGLEKGAFYQKEDGSIWVDLTSEGLDQKALLRKDGTAMYITQDIGTAILRFKDFPDTDYQIYTVGNEQEYHFKVLFKILKKLGFDQADKCFHLSYGMVELPEGKMKSREGTVVDADDIMAEMVKEAEHVAKEQGKLDGVSDAEKQTLYHRIGMSAIKYFLLKVDPVKNMLFNPKESIDFNGNTGPFIQYTFVRTKALERKFIDAFGALIYKRPSEDLVSKAEITLIKKINDFPNILEESAKTYNPSHIANYCYELVKEFNTFYHDFPILREQDEALRSFRISLCKKVGETVSHCMYMLGIEMVDRM